MSFYLLLLSYLVASFSLGFVWHVGLFRAYYKTLAIYSNIEKPKLSFGFSAMLLQGIVFAYVYPLVGNSLLFGFGLFLLLVSFMVFADMGKQNAMSLLGFMFI